MAIAHYPPGRSLEQILHLRRCRMSLEPLLHASPLIQIHAFVALAALVLGALQLFRKKGDRPHRTLGRIWVGLMAIVALSSFFIWTIRLWGLFSPIHLISIFTLVMLWRGVAFARRHDIRSHRRTMQFTYVLALVVTGLFTFLPGRTMYQVAFGPAGADPEKLAVFGAVLVAIALLVWLVMRWRRSVAGQSFLVAH
jgi:uncharacterized membrane protein